MQRFCLFFLIVISDDDLKVFFYGHHLLNFFLCLERASWGEGEGGETRARDRERERGGRRRGVRLQHVVAQQLAKYKEMGIKSEVRQPAHERHAADLC